MANCILITGSVTQALKAKHILAEHSISVITTKITAKTAKKGCVHGIEFNCQNRANIEKILKNAGLSFEVVSSDLP